ncbi:MAG: iron-containing alcohol dehydrogenase [Synergistaceae bacterium]|nr:iron-containing alcohol dehydrogenase [Synergistaceae bacterium]
MKSFNYFAPTEIVFGCGRVDEIGEYALRYGKKALLVTGSSSKSVASLAGRVASKLKDAGIETAHFNGVIPNPTTEVITKGAELAGKFGAETVIGIGGGSSMDAAKAIAVEATHPGTAWDYLHYTGGPTEKTLPIITIGTTAGTGSQTTPCSVITKTENKDKSAIWHKNIFPRVAIVDPETTLSMPPEITAQTGFDAFCHNFEAYISVGSNAFVEVMALEALKIIAEYLPKAIRDGGDIEARSKMAWADTLGGLSIASAGVTLPHGLGMQIGGHCPNVSHGQALAVTYPEFTRFTYKSAVAKFAAVGRVFNRELEKVSDEAAAEGCCEEIDSFLKRIGLWVGLYDLGVTDSDIRAIADCGQVLGDYKNNPRVAAIEEMFGILSKSRERM